MVSYCKLRKMSESQKENLLRLLNFNDVFGLKRNADILELYSYLGTPSASETEIGAASNILDGVDTPVLLAVRSTSASDTDSAAGHARTVKLLGWGTGTSSSGTVVLQEETVALNGLTPVSTTKYWTRILHFEVVSWGTGGKDAAGEIQVVDMTHSTYAAEKTTITATNSLLLADADWFKFYDFNGSTQASTRYNVWINKSGGGGAPTLDGTEIEVDISGTEDAQVSKVTAKAPGAKEVSTITATAPGDKGVYTIVAQAPGVAEISTITAKAFGTAEVSTVTALAFGTAEVSTIVADTFANCVDGSYITLYGIDATFADKGYYVWLDKVGDESGDPAPGSLTEIRCDISGDVTAQEVSDCITAAINGQADFGAANGGGTSTTVTITCARKGNTTNIADVDTGLAVATTTPGVTNMPDGSYINLYGIHTDYSENTYYLWFDKRGDSGGDPSPGGTGIRCDISADVTAQDISDCIKAAVDAVADFGAANGGGTSETVTITCARKGDTTNISDNDSTLSVATSTPGVTNMPDGSYLLLTGINATTKAEKTYYVWFDKAGDDGGDPAPGSYTECRCDISGDTTAQDVSDTIKAAIDALDEFGAANGGGTSETVTITNAVLGACTNIADNDSTLTVATSTPGVTNIADGSYFKIYGIDSTTKAETKYYVWFDWVGDESADPEVATFTEIRCDISADVSAQDVSDCITAAIGGKADFGAANEGGTSTTCTVTNATIGASTNITDGDSGLSLGTSTPGSLDIADGSYFKLYGVDSSTKAETKYYVWFDWIGDESGDPAPATFTEIRCDISSDVSTQDVAECIQAAIDAKGDFGATEDDTDVTVTNATIGACTNITDVDSGLAVTTTTPGTNVIVDGTYFTISAINGSGVQVDYYCWFDWIGDESGDPEVADHTEIRFDISSDVTKANVADCIQTAMHADSLFTATDDETDVTITNANAGDCDNIAAGDAGLTVSTETEGGSTATEVATAIVTAINNSAALVTAAETTYPSFSITNDYAGDATDTADGSAATNFTFVKNTDGDGPTTEYLSIDAGNNQSSGSRIYVPTGHQAVVLKMGVKALADIGNNSTTINMYRISFDNENNSDPDLDKEIITIWDLMPRVSLEIFDVPREGNDEAYLKFTENYTTGSTATDFRALIIIFK